MEKKGAFGFSLKTYLIIGLMLGIIGWIQAGIALAAVVLLVEKDRILKHAILQLCVVIIVADILQGILYIPIVFIDIFNVRTVRSFWNFGMYSFFNVVRIVGVSIVFVKGCNQEVIKVSYITEWFDKLIDLCENKIDIENMNSSTTCDTCGEKVKQDDCYCKKCGVKREQAN